MNQHKDDELGSIIAGKTYYYPVKVLHKEGKWLGVESIDNSDRMTYCMPEELIDPDTIERESEQQAAVSFEDWWGENGQAYYGKYAASVAWQAALQSKQAPVSEGGLLDDPVVQQHIDDMITDYKRRSNADEHTHEYRADSLRLEKFYKKLKQSTATDTSS